ncbi:MAG: T9SS type A sorting domain-containing protein, partial [Candidatus Zixiibacteriota bacterium]
CNDNTISNLDGTDLYLSAAIYGPDGDERIDDDDVGFPTYLGAQRECADGFKTNPQRAVFYYNGGIKIMCADSIDTRGDINMNGVANEIADVVMFTNYFIHGLSAFQFVEASVAASDVNADGVVLSVADLVYMIRVILGDGLPYPKTNPVELAYSFEHGTLNAGGELGAAFAIFEGETAPVLLAEQMEMNYRFDGENTRVIVFSTEPGVSFDGAFLYADGELIALEMATFDGQPVAARMMPDRFHLQQNYPNPFNPYTLIRFSVPLETDWTLSIYNVAGRLVDGFAGRAEGTGTVDVIWDGSDQASGVYLYRLEAGEFTQTRKMLLLK